MEINNSEEIPISTNEINTLNQNFPEIENKDQNKEKKTIKFDENTISVIPIHENYNLRYGDNSNDYKELDSQTKNIINDPKYADEKRSKSAFSKKTFREKYEPLKIKVPSNREWNRDPTAEIIIHNLEQKIDILTYENFLLSKKLREIENNNKELKLNISQNLLLMKAEQEMNNEQNKKKNFKDEMNLKNKENIENKKIKKNKKDKKEKDVDLFEEINRVKDENNRLRLSNQNLAENNAELNKVIETLKNEINLKKENVDDNYNNEKYNINNDMIDNNNEKFNNNNEQVEKNPNINLDENIININNDNNLAKIINNSEEKKMRDEQNNSEVDMNKYLQSEEQYHDLIEENELLHKKLRSLLSIEKDPNINLKNSISKTENINNISLKNKNDIQKEEIAKENYILKQKIRALNGEINRMAVENNRKILIIQQKLEEYESKQRENLIMEQNKLNSQNEIEKKRKEEELDEILNETLLVMDRNQDDEESRKMIETIKNIKNEQKKRISQCLIINNKLKSLLQENAQLHNQLLISKKENEIINNSNSNFNKTNTSNMNNNNNTNPHICFCGSGNFSVNALKIKDEMIIKYKDKIDENNEILKLTQNSNNSNNSNNNRSNELNFIEKDYNIPNKYKKEKNDGFEDYLLGKIVNNQKEVLGERAPRFYENNNININNKYVAKSMQYDDGNKMNNRYNNYHYRGRIMEDDE